MSGPHVLHVVTNETWGGACRVAHLLATECEGEATVFCGPGERLRERLRNDSVPVIVEPRLQSAPSPVADIRVLNALYRTIVTSDPDVVHCHSTKAGALGRLAALRAGVPTVFTVHGWGFYNASGLLSRAVQLGERLLAPRTDALVCVSDHDYEQGRRRDIVDPTRTRVIRNGVPPVEGTAKAILSGELGEPGTPIIGTLGRLAEQKNPLAVLRTARRLRDRDLSATTVLIGDGPKMTACRRYRDRHDVAVQLLGFREDGHDLLAGLDVFVLPSRFEGLPLTVLEAMHRAVPVVAYDVGGVAEAVRDGETGYVVPAGDERALTDRVARLVEDRKRREEMGRRAREVAREAFTTDRMCAEYDTVYRRVAAGGVG